MCKSSKDLIFIQLQWHSNVASKSPVLRCGSKVQVPLAPFSFPSYLSPLNKKHTSTNVCRKGRLFWCFLVLGFFLSTTTSFSPIRMSTGRIFTSGKVYFWLRLSTLRSLAISCVLTWKSWYLLKEQRSQDSEKLGCLPRIPPNSKVRNLLIIGSLILGYIYVEDSSHFSWGHECCLVFNCRAIDVLGRQSQSFVGGLHIGTTSARCFRKNWE